MRAPTIYFYNNSSEPVSVKTLFFNENFNIYEAATDHFIASFPIKGCTLRQTGSTMFVHSQNPSIFLKYEGDIAAINEVRNKVEYQNQPLARRIIKHKAFTLLFSFLILLAFVYFLIISLVPYLGSKIINRENEISIGKKLHELMIQQELATGASIDTAGTKELQEFVDKLKLSNYPLHLTLIKSKIVNAYALPGGEIVVYTGILEKMESYEALVALLAHESTHINQRHSLKSLLRSAANNIFISILFNDPTGIAGAVASNVENINGLKYSRSLESEADNYGMQLMLANNIDLRGMKQLMTVLNTQGDMHGELSFLSSHPLTEERIKNAGVFIDSHKNNFIDRDDLRELFLSLKSRNGAW